MNEGTTPPEGEQKPDRSRAKADYKRLLQDVEELEVMTKTPSWAAFYGYLRERITRHGRDILHAEKTRDIIGHQEGVKILESILEHLSGPVEELRAFIKGMPLFTAEFPKTAHWDESLGVVVVEKTEKPKA